MADRFSMLRSILRTLGLSEESVDQIIDFIVDLLGGEKEDTKKIPKYEYRLNGALLSPAEAVLFLRLSQLGDESVIVCPKVNLRDIFKVEAKDQSHYRIAYNRIDRKHVDFLICSKENMQPLFAIELDDRSHQRKDRQERDAFVDEVFAQAKLPLYHIPVQREYDVQKLHKLFDLHPSKGKSKDAPFESSAQQPTASSPACPKCGGQMALRTAQRGNNAGKQFWGCVKYPQCRGVLPSS